MKLTEKQIAWVGRYLENENLNFKSFYDEILDHLCLDIEHRTAAGSEFEVAFLAAALKLNETSTKKRHWLFGGLNYSGIKAIENDNYQAKDLELKLEYLSILWARLTSVPGILISFLVLLAANFTSEILLINRFPDGFLFPLLGMILLHLWSAILLKNPLIDKLRDLAFKLFLNGSQIKNIANEKVHASWKVLLFPLCSAGLFYFLLTIYQGKEYPNGFPISFSSFIVFIGVVSFLQTTALELFLKTRKTKTA